MSENKKEVFIVTSGCYSEYGIERVFSTRESAKDYIDTCSHECQIEVYQIDAPIIQGNKIFCVILGLNNKGEAEVEPAHEQLKDLIKVSYDMYDSAMIYIYVESDSRKRAIKIASDRYGAIIANEQTKYPYLRNCFVKSTWSCKDTAYFDFFTGEVVLQSDDRLLFDLPDFVKIAKRQIKF